MPRSRRLLALVPAPSARSTAERLTPPLAGLLAPLALLVVVTSAAGAQGGTPLHLAADRFEFVASGDAPPAAKPLRVHNGGTARFTDVRLTKLAYADSSSGSAWLVPQLRQSAVAPDELATVATLCVDASGLPAGTYRATAAVAAREVPEPVAFTITLVVKDAAPSGGTRPAAASCGIPVTK